MEFHPIAGADEMRKEYDDFFREEIRKAPTGWGDITSPEGNAFARHISLELGKRGWMCLSWPKKYGGLGKSIFEQLAFNEAKNYWQAPGIDSQGPSMVGPIVLSHGTEGQKQKFALPIARGETWWAQLWSETNAGSDLASVQTFAKRDGDYYVVNGQKIWTSGAHYKDWAHLVVRTSRELTRSRGLSYMLIDLKSPGITIRPLPTMSSHRKKIGHFNEVFLDNVRVPVENRIGEENDGWRTIRSSMNFERSRIDTYGSLKRELAELIEFCQKTSWQGEPLSKNPLVRNRLAQIAIDIDAGLASARHVLWGQHKIFLGEAPPREQTPRSSAQRYYLTELAQRFYYYGCEILGLYSQLKGESKWAPMYGKFEREYQDTVGHLIAAGSTEIQKNIIAWEGLGLPRK